MDAFLASLRSMAAQAGTQQLGIISAIGLAAFLFALGVSFAAAWAFDPVRRRLAGFVPESGGGPGLGSRIAAVLAPVSRYVLPTKESEISEMGRRLYFAGFHSAAALSVFYGIKMGLAVALPAVWLLVSAALPQVSTGQVTYVALLAAGIGLVLPNYVLDHLAEKHKTRLRNAFPDALDMLVVCVESGLGLSAALQRVSEELAVSHPELAGELAIVNAEMRAGVERETALRNFANRTGLEDVRGLVALMIQTLRFGTSIAEALRVYSEEFRDKRMQRAEEQAAKIGTKLIFPLVLCLFPGFFVVAIGPAVIRIIDVFSQLGARVAQ
jgi:tight adherence protein C